MITLRDTVKTLGAMRIILGFTLIAILVSVLLTFLVAAVLHLTPRVVDLVIAVLVPIVVAPLTTLIAVRIFFIVDEVEAQLREMSVTDMLTQVFNRRRFVEMAEKEFVRAKRYNDIFSVAILDIDDFKAINDSYGHLAGDAALKMISEKCVRTTRDEDLFARYGGEEFVFLFPQTEAEEATQFLEKVRKDIATERLRFGDDEIQLTVSVGVKAYEQQMEDLDNVLNLADEALYEAKRSGKNRIVAA